MIGTIFMNNIEFRKVEGNDYNSIAEVFNFYIKNSTAIAFFEPLSTQEIASYFNIEKASTHAFCIYWNSAFCGFCLIQQYSQKDGYKYTSEITIYLKQEFKSKGIGTAAVLHLEEIAKLNCIKTIVAGISSENIESINLFEKNNYVKCGHFKNMVCKFDRILDNIYYQKLI
jgi:L-amino acid N-acyltransferase YncA